MIDTLGDYLVKIGRYKLLTPSEEIELSRAMKSENAAKAKRARERLINANLRLVVSIAKHYKRRCKSMELLDIIQYGNIGLSYAAEKFDFERGYKFSTYAYWWIKQYISRGISNDDLRIRLPINMHETWNMAAKKGNGNVKKGFELLGKDESYFWACCRAMNSEGSLDVGINDDHSGALINAIADENFQESSFLEELGSEVEPLLAALTERQRQIVALKFGIGDNKERTLTDVGKHYGISREAVRQTIEKSLRRMRIAYGYREAC